MTYVSYLELQDPDRGSFAIYTFFQTLTAHNLTRIFGIFTIQNIKTRVGNKKLNFEVELGLSVFSFWCMCAAS